MPNDILHDMHRYEGLARIADLIAGGHSASTIRRRLADGTLVRVCHGWVATRSASQHAELSVLHRGKLAGPSVLLDLGVWDGAMPGIHIQRLPNSHGAPRVPATPLAAFRAPDFVRVGIVTRWMPDRFVDRNCPPWRQSVIDALLYIAKFAPPEQFLACLESAVHEGALSRAGLPTVLSMVPPRLRWVGDHLDLKAESGLETLTRVRLARLVRSIETQVSLPGIARSGRDGSADILIDNWLVIEVDGDRWHDPAADRRRTSILVRLGYRVHRFGYDDIINHWPDVERTVLELLRYPPR